LQRNGNDRFVSLSSRNVGELAQGIGAWLHLSNLYLERFLELVKLIIGEVLGTCETYTWGGSWNLSNLYLGRLLELVKLILGEVFGTCETYTWGGF